MTTTLDRSVGWQKSENGTRRNALVEVFVVKMPKVEDLRILIEEILADTVTVRAGGHPVRRGKRHMLNV